LIPTERGNQPAIEQATDALSATLAQNAAAADAPA
jgi:hypothetical protein